MSERSYIVPGALFLGLAAYVMVERGKRQARQSFANLDVAMTGVHDEQGTLILTVKVINPNPIPMEVKSLVGTMYVNNMLVAKVNMIGDYIAQANNQITLPIIVQPVSSNIAIQLIERIRNKWRGITQFKGVINVNNNALPVQMRMAN